MQWIIGVEVDFGCAFEDNISYIVAFTRAQPQPETFDRRIMLARDLNPGLEFIRWQLRCCVLPVEGISLPKEKRETRKLVPE